MLGDLSAARAAPPSVSARSAPRVALAARCSAQRDDERDDPADEKHGKMLRIDLRIHFRLSLMRERFF